MNDIVYKELSYKITGLLYKTHKELGRFRNEKQYKVKNFITKEDYYQLQRYLFTLNLKLGMLVNFRQNRLVPKRVLNSSYK
jgi:hypothetical protein